MIRNKCNILVVVRWPLGGIRTYMKYVYKYLPKEKFNITVLAFETIESRTFVHDMKEIGARYVQINAKRKLLGFMFDIFKLISNNRFDIVQSHGFISAICAFIPSLIFNKPHVLTIHGIIEEKLIGRGFISIIKIIILRSILKNVECIYAVSNEILKSVMATVKLERDRNVHIIHTGIDLQEFGKEYGKERESSREVLGVPIDKKIIGFVGRFMPQKGFNYLIDAMEILKNDSKLDDIIVLAVGSGDYQKEYINEIIKRDLKNAFQFLPFQTNMKNVYQSIDVLAMPSIWEAYPLQAVEAIVMGVPIIVSDCLGIKECVIDTPAVIIPTNNAKALADAICNFGEEKMDEFKKFRAVAKNRYDAIKTAQSLEEIFRSYCQIKESCL